MILNSIHKSQNILTLLTFTCYVQIKVILHITHYYKANRSVYKLTKCWELGTWHVPRKTFLGRRGYKYYQYKLKI